MNAAAPCRKLPRFHSLCFVMLALLSVTSTKALDLDKKISQFGHTAWRIQDGYFTGTQFAITQTTDGYLWIGSGSGLWRFDGARFVPWIPPQGKSLPGPVITALLGSRDGSLWIGTSGGLSRWKDGELTNYTEPAGVVTYILERSNGEIWFSLNQYFAPKVGLCQVTGKQLHCFGNEEAPSLTMAMTLAEDASGDLWIGTNEGLIHWEQAKSTFHGSPRLKGNKLAGVISIAPARDNSLWVGIAMRGSGLGLAQLVGGSWKPFITPEFDGTKFEISSVLLDRQNALWVGTAGQGIFRIRGQQVDHFGAVDGLSSDLVGPAPSFFEDREGNVWVSTSKGIDCFRDLRVTTFTKREGLSNDEVDAVLASHDGRVWFGGPRVMDTLLPGSLSIRPSEISVPGELVTALLEDHAGRLWIGVDNSLWVFDEGKLRRVNGLGGKPVGFVVGMAEDSDHDVWAETRGSPRTLLCIRDLQVQEEFPDPAMPAARRVGADPSGGIWLGLATGDLAHYAHGDLKLFRFSTNMNDVPTVDSMVNDLMINPDGSLLGATAHGVNAVKNGKQQRLTVRNGLPCDDVEGLITDNNDDLWLYAQCGLMEIESQELQKWWQQPDAVLKVKLLDALDGVQPGHAPFNATAKSADGKLWFAGLNAVQMVDPGRITPSVRPAAVHIEEFVADRRQHVLCSNLSLPPASRDLEITYTAPSFAAPQKVMFRYQLEGHDTDWQEAGTRRKAFYSDLPPGPYRFRVEASDSDGVWSGAGASLDFRILPAWYQTAWFRASSVLLFILVLLLIHRLRVRYVAQAISARADERLAERTRMARELHDTFVQTIQGSKLVVDDVLEKPDDREGMLRALKQLAVWLDQATQEARAALSSLRDSATERNDLSEAFQRATESSFIPSSMAVSLSVLGDIREMHPIVRDEIYRIGYEAIRNAAEHSRASRLEIELRHARELTLRVRDNGVGIDPAVLDKGKQGHFGLSGMRERAGRIGGKLTLVSNINAGTVVTLVIPEGATFRPTSQTLLAKAFQRIYDVFTNKAA